MLCPSCSAPISDSARFCEHCGRSVPRETSDTEQRGIAALPEKFQVTDDGYELRISWNWFTPVVLFLVFFCVFWDGFLLVWYGMVFTMSSQMGAMALIFLLFPLIHVAIGVGLTWYVICAFVNRTTVAVRQGLLSVSHGPLWWPGNLQITTDNLRQLYSKEKFHRSKNGGGSYSYAVYAMTDDGKSKKLISNLTEQEQALYLEQAIEKHLNIRDEPVAGEISR